MASTSSSPTRGGPPQARALELDDEALRAAVEANLLTSIRLVRAAVPHMRRRRAGVGSCCITSVAMKQPIPDLAASNAARTGLWAWAKSAAADLIDDAHHAERAGAGVCTTPTACVRWVTPDPEATRQTSAGSPRSCARSHTGFLSGIALQVDGAATLGLL